MRKKQQRKSYTTEFKVKVALEAIKGQRAYSTYYCPLKERYCCPMAFNLEEWNKLSEDECERRYKQRLRDEEWGKTLIVIVAFVLLVWLLIAIFRASPETTVARPGSAFADSHMER